MLPFALARSVGNCMHMNMQQRNRAWLPITAALSLVLAVGCGGNNDAAGAAVATGIALAGAGVNRAATKDCWARCSSGWVCNQETGLCEKGECIPSCSPGYACTRSTRGNLCVADGTPLSDPVGDPTRADRLGPRGTRGDPLAPETAAERNAKNPQLSEGGQVAIPRGDPGSVQEASSEPERDDLRKVPQAEYQERGEEIFAQLDSLVAAWSPRLSASPSDPPEEVAGPPSADFLAYVESLHRSSLHDVYSRGWLGRLDELSKTHALSNLALEITVGLVIAEKTGAIERIFVIKSSGSELFDVGALEAITRASPFPAPPATLTHGEDSISLSWRLFRHAEYACSTSFARRLAPTQTIQPVTGTGH